MGEDRADMVDRSPISSLNVSWNSIPGVCAVDDPIVWHCAGMEMRTRLDAMRSLSNPDGSR